MEDDQQKEAINGSSSLSLSTTITSHPSRKRLLSDNLKPKQALTAASLSDQFPKKTRDIPNLSNCHGCGLRINYSNPKERLQTLDSLWRIVLLCKKCFKFVESAEICSYCFAATCREVCFRCINCKRCIHKDCVVKFRRFPPWSYCCFETRFSYCVDCCVPKLLVKSTRVYRRRNSRVSVNINNPRNLHDENHGSCSRDASTNGEVDDEDLAYQSSRISKDECLLNSNSLAVPLKSGECTVCEKLEVCTNDKLNEKIDRRRKNVDKSIQQQGSVGDSRVSVNSNKPRNLQDAMKNLDFLLEKKIVDAAMEANSAVRLVAKKDENHGSCSSDDPTNYEEEDDVDLAYQSPRKSKNKCLLNSSSWAVPVKSAECTICEKLEVCTNDKLNEKIDRTLSEPSVCLRVSDLDSSAEFGNLHSKQNMTQGSQGISNMIHINGDYDRNRDRYFFKYSKKTDRNKGILGVRSFSKKQDRYLLKYRKRSVKSKAESNTETKFCGDSLHLENKDSTQSKSDDRYFLKYSKKAVSSKKQFQSCAIRAQ